MRKVTVVAMVLMCSVWALPVLAADVDPAEPFLGKWIVKMERQGQTFESTLELKQADDGKLTGTWESQRGKSDLKEVKVDAKLSQLTFTRTFSGRGQEISMVTKAKIKDGKLVGTVTTPRGERPFTAIRPKIEEEAAQQQGRPTTAKAMLERMDTDGDGKVQESEAPERMQQFFGMLDSNGDGELDEAEIEVMMEYRRQQGGN